MHIRLLQTQNMNIVYIHLSIKETRLRNIHQYWFRSSISVWTYIEYKMPDRNFCSEMSCHVLLRVVYSGRRLTNCYYLFIEVAPGQTERSGHLTEKEKGLVSTLKPYHLTHWDRVTHICVNKLAIIGSDNGLSPGRRQAILWTNAGILLIASLGTNFFSEILIEIHIFSLKKIRLNITYGKWRPFCLGFNVLRVW